MSKLTLGAGSNPLGKDNVTSNAIIDALARDIDWSNPLTRFTNSLNEKTRILDEKLAGKDKEIVELTMKVRQAYIELKKESQDRVTAESAKKNLTTQFELLEKQKKLRHILDNISAKGQEYLLDHPDFFDKQQQCTAFVMSVDLRRSTELMLKAVQNERFAEFITELCTDLKAIVMTNLGVFDKFTGDGILCFFPTFYSGEDAGLRAVVTASECHNRFSEIYRKHRSSFASVLLDTGLGIGIDFGEVSLLSSLGTTTVVGRPVVYACRMGGAPAGTTLLNQPAFSILNERYSACCKFDEVTIDVKNEGPTLAYKATLSGTSASPKPPAWPVTPEIKPPAASAATTKADQK